MDEEKVDSRDLAERYKICHWRLLEIRNDYKIKEFEEIEVLDDEKDGSEYMMLNEVQASLILLFAENSAEVIGHKRNLVKAIQMYVSQTYVP